PPPGLAEPPALPSRAPCGPSRTTALRGGGPAPDGFQGGGERALGPLHLRPWAHVNSTRGGAPGARLPRRPRAVPDLSQPAAAHTRRPPRNAGQRARGISPLTRHHIGGQRHPPGIENRLQHFDLWHVRAIVLAVTTLAEPPSRTVADALALGLSPCPRW